MLGITPSPFPCIDLVPLTPLPLLTPLPSAQTQLALAHNLCRTPTCIFMVMMTWPPGLRKGSMDATIWVAGVGVTFEGGFKVGDGEIEDGKE